MPEKKLRQKSERRFCCIAFSTLLVLGALIVRAEEKLSPTTTQEGPRRSTLADQIQVALTVYNVNLALVKEQREIDFAAGNNVVHFMDVAAQIMPTTVHVKSLNDAQELRVLEQNYEYDLLSPTKLMDKYVGKEVKLYDKNYYTGKDEWLVGTLMSTNDGYIYQIGSDIHINPTGRVILPQIPDNLIAKPTLVWLLRTVKAGKQKIETSYLTNNITWQADYIAVLNADDTVMDFTGWVSIDNKSGATYNNVTLKLVAGDVHRIQPKAIIDRALALEARAEQPAPQFKEEGFFEYHLYTLDRPTTVKDNQTKQMTLLTASAVPVARRFILKGQRDYFYTTYTPDAELPPQKVSVYLEIENAQKNNLGFPLPKGTVRVYKADQEGNQQFVGEDQIDHTAKDETVKIKMGEAFDIGANRRQTDYKKISSTVTEEEWEIVLRNHKEEPVTVRISEPVPGDWEVLSSSHKHEKAEAHTLQFDVTVPKSASLKVTYRVRIRM